MSTQPEIEEFELAVCSETGDPGCMDCVEGQCPGSFDAHIIAHRCTECGADDAFGELAHEEHCPLFVDSSSDHGTQT